MTPALPWAMSWIPGGRWLLPLIVPLTLYPAFLTAVREKRYLAAWWLGIAWAALLSLGIVALTYGAPEAAADTVFNAEPYRAEMFGWIESGVGPEVRPRQFIPQHLAHLGLFLLLSWISAGFLGLVLGAGLVDYMSYFVASYGIAAELPLLGPVAAWVPWSVVRVAAFVLLGVLFARPVIDRRPWPFDRREHLLMSLALGGIGLDIFVKWALAPAYGEWLLRLAGGQL